jgi:hypothetical protein
MSWTPQAMLWGTAARIGAGIETFEPIPTAEAPEQRVFDSRLGFVFAACGR